MNLSYEWLPEGNLDAAYDIWQYVYRGGERVPDEERVCQPGEQVAVARIDGEPVAALLIFPMEIHRGEATLSCAGLAAVAVLQGYRRQGVGRSLVEWFIRETPKMGFQISSLYAFREPYYRKFGYELAGWRNQIIVPQGRMPQIARQLPIRQISADRVGELDECYELWNRKFVGGNRRLPWQWVNRMGSNRPVILAAGDPIEAYTWTHIPKLFWQDMILGELAWSTRRGYETILSAIPGLLESQNSILWHEPFPSPFVSRYRDHGMSVELQRPTMWRLIDVPGALQKITTTERGSFTIEIVDDLLSQHRGPWKVSFGDGGVHVEPAKTATLKIPIGFFTAAYLGQPTLKELADFELVEIHDPKEFHAACRLLTGSSVYCTEFF